MSTKTAEQTEIICNKDNAREFRDNIAQMYSKIRNNLERQNSLVSYLDFCTLATAELSQVTAHNKAVVDLLDDIMFDISELTDLTKAYLDYKLSVCAIPEEVTEENTEETT